MKVCCLSPTMRAPSWVAIGAGMAGSTTHPRPVLRVPEPDQRAFEAAGLVSALAHHGLDHMGAHDKSAMRDFILAGGPWSEADWQRILDYCESDVEALMKLLPEMLPLIDLPRALFRGRYMAAAAGMEHNGIPIDLATLLRIERHREPIKDQLIAKIDKDFGVMKDDRFAGEDLPNGCNSAASPGRTAAMADCVSMMRPFVIWSVSALRWRRSGSFGRSCRRRGLRRCQSAAMVAIGPCSQR